VTWERQRPACTSWNAGSYLRPPDGKDSRSAVSLISRHEDRTATASRQTTVLRRQLVMAAHCVSARRRLILVLETDNRDSTKYTDPNGDGVADKKEPSIAGSRVHDTEWRRSA